MIQTILNTAIPFLTSAVLGYCLNIIKNYKNQTIEDRKNEDIQNKALLMLLQHTLTNNFFVYNEIGKIPDYVHRNWTNLATIYKQLGGNDYIHVLEEKMKEWEIVKTDILK